MKETRQMARRVSTEKKLNLKYWIWLILLLVVFSIGGYFFGTWLYYVLIYPY